MGSAGFTRAYQNETNRLAREAMSDEAQVAAELSTVQRRIDGIMRAIEDGLYQQSMKARLAELEAEKAALVARRSMAPTPPNGSVHPNLAAVYRRKVEELETLLEDAEHRDEAMELLRSLIGTIVLTPKEAGGLDALLHGDLARILVLCSTGSEQAKTPEGGALRGLSLSVVAGIGFEPMTFRL